MSLRGVLLAFGALTLLAGMFIAVHRGARGRALAEEISAIADRQAATEVRLAETRREIGDLRSRTRVVRSARQLGFHLPEEEELVILDLSAPATALEGGADR